jgi:succinoglycan biosynthesis transport protein ExoP
VTVRQILQLLWARRWLFGLVFVSLVSAVTVLTLLWPKTYISEVSVVIGSKTTDPVSGMESPDVAPSNIATQADVITSHNVALKVVNKLGLASNPQIREEFERATQGEGSIKDWLADQLQNNVEVKPARESHVLNIDVSAREPEAAAAVANAFADAFIQTTLELKMEPARRQTAWFDEQLQELRKSLETSQAHLSDYQRSHNVVGTSEQIDVENGRLVEISNQLVAAQGAMYEAQTRLKQLKEAGSQQDRLRTLPDILANPLLQGMKADLARAEGKLAETSERYGRNHPEYVSAAAEVKSLQAKLSNEITTVSAAIQHAALQTSGQVTELRRALDQQRDRLLQLKRQRDDVDVLRHEVDTAQHMYEAGMQRATQVRLESQLDQSNIAILNPAVPPTRPARPKVATNILVSIVLGAILGAAAVMVGEYMDRRVRNAQDLIELAGIPVLAEIPRRRRRDRRPALRLRRKPALSLLPGG